MASSRKTGVNESISTYGAVGFGRDYTVLATWEAATDINLVTSTISYVLECYDDAASFDDYVTLAGATTNASYFRIIRPASVQGHDGTPNTGVWFSGTTDTNLFNLNEQFSSIQDIIGTLTINSINNRAVFQTVADNGHVVGCIAWDGINSGTGAVRGFGAGTAVNNTTFINCLGINNEYGNFGIAAITGDTCYLYNCTAYGSADEGFCTLTTAGTGTTVFTNCLSTGNTDGDFIDYNAGANVITATYNASGDATADDWGGAGNRVNQSANFVFVNAAGDDYHLDSTDAGAKDFGTDLSGTFNDDIDFEIRTGVTWDIGFDEYLVPTGVELITPVDEERATFRGAFRGAFLGV